MSTKPCGACNGAGMIDGDVCRICHGLKVERSRTKRLQDGESKIIRPSRNFSMSRNKSFEVVATRVDCDTPFVQVSIAHCQCDPLWLTDTQALDLIDRLQRALSILPTSK